MKRIGMTMLLICAILFSGCGVKQQSKTISKTEMLMDTVVTITLWDWEDETVLNDCMELCRQLEVQFDSDAENGEISLINRHNGEIVPVSDTTRELLEIGKEYEALSDGKFSMGIGALSSLWDFHEATSYLPTEEEIIQARKTIDQDALSIREEGVCLSGQGTKLDLGAIAKGYSADLLKRYLQEQGVKSGIIDLGGNVLLIGQKPDHTPFTVGIQQPFAETSTVALGVKVSDRSVVTSGIYQRYFQRNDKLYHHILDPDTGYPVETDLYSVTVLSKHSVDGDALSTICMLLGLEKGKELIESTPDTEAIFVTDQNEIIYTSGISDEMLVK